MATDTPTMTEQQIAAVLTTAANIIHRSLPEKGYAPTYRATERHLRTLSESLASGRLATYKRTIYEHGYVAGYGGANTVMADSVPASPPSSEQTAPQPSEKARELTRKVIRHVEPLAGEYDRAHAAFSALEAYIADIERERNEAILNLIAARKLRDAIAADFDDIFEKLASYQRVVDAAREMWRTYRATGNADYLTMDDLASALDSLSQPTEDAGT